MLLRYLVANGPRCLRCLMFMPLGSVELLFLLHLCSVNLYFLGGKGLDCMVYVPVDFVCAIWSDICELFVTAFALSMSVMAVLVPKQMLLFCCVGGFLLNSFAMVPHRKCGLCL